jgi:hypothetical protein
VRFAGARIAERCNPLHAKWGRNGKAELPSNISRPSASPGTRDAT